MMRHRGTPESVGRGVAVGLFSAFIVPVGHMLLAFPLAILARGARASAVLSTWIINPLTLSVVYPIQCYLGSFIIGDPLSYALIKQRVMDFFNNLSWETAWVLGRELIVAFFVGGAVLGIGAAIIGYFCTVTVVRRHRTQLAERKKNRTNLCRMEG
ncbi:MAG: DUF2062 domain-containing protein [Verrucomicrobia bacterium]|nr:DUF2062 domain-containing protein [Verrucomicrobiota bacterium]